MFERMSKGYMAVMLFLGGSRGGVTWTLGGHFLAATSYKYENGKHYLYMRDPGGRDHDGWYCYETTMKGLVYKVWTCTASGATPVTTTSEKKSTVKTTYKGKYPTNTISKNTGTKENKKRWQTFLCWWGPDVTKDGIFGDDTKKKTIAF